MVGIEQMKAQEHYRKLENLYASAPINIFYQPVIHISDGIAEIEIAISNKFFHAAHAVHGSVYFKMLDDSAFFAANSLEPDVFVLTTTFTTYLTRPVSAGKLRSLGKVVNKNKTQFIAEAVLYDADNNEVGRGSGIFVRSNIRLCEDVGYSL